MSDSTGVPGVHDLTVEEVARRLSEGRILLVDVREPNETALESYPQAVYLPFMNQNQVLRNFASQANLALAPPLGPILTAIDEYRR